MKLDKVCRYKKWLKKCPYFKIKEAEEMIERERQILSYMQTETIKCEKALKKADIKALYRLEKTYHDGFSWADTITASMPLEVPLAIEKLQFKQEGDTENHPCPYKEQPCQQVMDLKISHVRFLRRKITQATAYYNELIGLLQVVLSYHSKDADQKEKMFISFHPSNRLALVYFNLEHFRVAEDGHYAVCLFYQDEETLEMMQDWIEYDYEVASEALEGTSLAGINQAPRLIKVYLPNRKIKGFEAPIMMAVNDLIKTLNHQFGRRYEKIQGSYIQLEDYSLAQQTHIIALLEPLGYKILGQINSQGIFEEKRLLLYLCQTLKRVVD